MTRREEVITTLLERLDELSNPMRGHAGAAGDGASVSLMPHEPNCLIRTIDLQNDDRTPVCTCYLRGILELHRLLARMRSERPSQWSHVNARYVLCQFALKDVPVKRKAKNGKTVTVLDRRRVPIYAPWVRAEKVRRGVSWLADEWALPVEPMLPKAALQPLPTTIAA